MSAELAEEVLKLRKQTAAQAKELEKLREYRRMDLQGIRARLAKLTEGLTELESDIWRIELAIGPKGEQAP